MKKFVTVAGSCVVAALVGVTAVAIAVADSPGSPRAALSVFIPGEPPPGPFATGDQLVTVDAVLDPHSGAEIGKAVTRLVFAEVTEDDATFVLDCTVQLSEGNLAFYGAESFSSFADGVTYTVVGGTGRYQGTRGVVHITGGEVGGQPGSLLDFDITRR